MQEIAYAPAGRRRNRTARAALGLVVGWLAPALVLAGLVAGALLVALPSSGEHGRELFPLAPGTTSVFQTTEDGKPTGLHVSVVTGRALLVGVPGSPTATAVSDHYDDYEGDGSPLDALSYLGWRGNDLVSYGFRYQGTFYPTAPAEPTAELALRAGQGWHWQGKQGGAVTRATSTFVGYTSVRALGRTLEHCPRYRTTSVSTGADGRQSTDVEDTWACSGIGTVKIRDVSNGHTDVERLVRFSAPGRTLAAPGALPAVASSGVGAIPGSGPGVDPQRSNAVRRAGEPAEHPAWTLDLQHPAQVVGDGKVTVTADSEGTVTSIDRRTGEVLWRVTVPTPLAAPPVLAGPLVLVGDAAKHLQAFDARTGAVRWTATFPDLLASAPAVSGGIVVAVGQDKVVRALRLADGRQLWTAHLASLTETPPAIVGDTVVVGEEEGTLTAFSLADGEDRWESSVEGLLSAGPAAGAGLVVASDDAGAVYGFDAASGRLRWNRYVGGTVEFAPAVAGTRVLVVAGERKLVALAAADGRVEWSRTFAEKLAAGPVVLGDHVLVQHEEGSLSQLSLSSGVEERTIELPEPAPDASADQPLTYFGGALVATLRFDAPYLGTSVIALPAQAPGRANTAGAGGVSFRQTPQQIAPPVGTGGPFAPPVLSGGQFLFPGWDGKLWDVPVDGRPSALANVKLSFFALPDGDLVLTQQGTNLVAIPRKGGAPRWRFPIGAPSPAEVPALTRNRVVVAAAGQGLVALDPATGRPRWFFRDAGQSVSPPLALPDGDVVWAGPSGLVRIDGSTGRRVWSLPGVVAFGPLAEQDGLILVDGGYRNVQRMLAVRARTGRVQWLTNPLPASEGVGPAAGDGVVVAAGADAVVRAFALATGRPLWSAPLRTAPDGPPVILGDRLVIAQKGRAEDLDAQAHTITVHDLHSGRLLGLLQLPGAGNGNALSLSFGPLGASRVVEYAAPYLYTVRLTG